MIDPTNKVINRLFVHLFKAGEYDSTRNSFVKYYISLVEIKDFNVWINNKPFFDQIVKTRGVWKTCWNVKKWWSYRVKLIILLVSSKLL